MPQVNVKYELKLDSTVRTEFLKFMNTPIDLYADRNGNNYSGKVCNVEADSMLKINMFLAGSKGKWILQVWVRELDEANRETGEWIPLKGNGRDLFEGAIQLRNSLNNYYPIKRQA